MIGMSAIARAFVEARRSASVLDGYPGAIPITLADGYRIQDIAIDIDGRTVRGWKVGRVPVDLVERYGADRLAGPIFEVAIWEAGDGVPTMPILGGFAAVEAEIMLRLRRDVGTLATIEEVIDTVDMARFGIEIASSPFPAINDHGPAVTVSDFGNNYGLLLGPEIADWSEPGALNRNVELFIDGKRVGVGSAADLLDGPLGSVRFLSQLLQARQLGLKRGDWISTGAITGVHRARHGQRIEAIMDGSCAITCMLAERTFNNCTL